MPGFNYSGYDSRGKRVKGALEASSSVQAVERLTERGIVVVDDQHKLHFPETFRQVKPDWLSAVKGVDLTKKPEFVQYEP